MAVNRVKTMENPPPFFLCSIILIDPPPSLPVNQINTCLSLSQIADLLWWLYKFPQEIENPMPAF